MIMNRHICGTALNNMIGDGGNGNGRPYVITTVAVAVAACYVYGGVLVNVAAWHSTLDNTKTEL